MNPETLYDQARRKSDQASSFQGTVADLDNQLERMRIKVEQYEDEMRKLQVRRDDAARQGAQAAADAESFQQQADDAQKRREIEEQTARELERGLEQERLAQEEQQAA